MSDTKTILVPLSNNFEEIEFVSIVDILRRANIEVITAGLDESGLYKGAHNIEIFTPLALNLVDTQALDGIVLAGGMSDLLKPEKNTKVIQIIKSLYAQKKLIAAICAAPLVLNAAGVLQGEFTCYPSFEKTLNGTRTNRAVVVNENIITSAGPATAVLFGLEIVKYLLGEGAYQALYDELLLPLTY